MVENLAIAAVLVFFLGIGLSVLIGAGLRNRDLREAEQRAAARQQLANRRQKTGSMPRRTELTPAAAAKLALNANLTRSPGRRS
jgi:hypothetical protein